MTLEVPRGRPGKETASTEPTKPSVTQPGRWARTLHAHRVAEESERKGLLALANGWKS